MKNNKYRIIGARLLLLLFIAGQVVIFSHQHKQNSSVVTNYSSHHNSGHLPQQTVSEKCAICDAMHFNHILPGEVVYFTPTISEFHFYVPGKYSFVSLSLTLAAGRAPPSTFLNC